MDNMECDRGTLELQLYSQGKSQVKVVSKTQKLPELQCEHKTNFTRNN